MEGTFTVPCELTIVPGAGPSQQNKIILRANGETVFCEYEDNLTESQRDVAKQIAHAHGRMLTKWADQTVR